MATQTLGWTPATQPLGVFPLNFIPDQVRPMQIRGTDTIICLYDETAYAATPGSPDARKLYPTSFGFRTAQGRTPSTTLSGTRTRQEGFMDTENPTGPLAGEIAPETFGLILKHALGTVVTTGANPYTHTITAGALPAGMLFEVDHGAGVSGSGRYLRHSGVRVNQLTMDFPSSGPTTFSADLIGSHTAAAGSPLDATPTDYGHTPFDAMTVSLQEGGSAIATVKKLTVMIGNNLDTDGFVVGGQGQRQQLSESWADVTASFQAQFTDASLLNKALSGTETSLVVTLSRGTGLGAAGNESLMITLAQGKYEKTNDPIDGPNGLVIDLKFVGYRKGSIAPITAVLKCPVATL